MKTDITTMLAVCDNATEAIEKLADECQSGRITAYISDYSIRSPIYIFHYDGSPQYSIVSFILDLGVGEESIVATIKHLKILRDTLRNNVVAQNNMIPTIGIVLFLANFEDPCLRLWVDDNIDLTIFFTDSTSGVSTIGLNSLFRAIHT